MFIAHLIFDRSISRVGKVSWTRGKTRTNVFAFVRDSIDEAPSQYMRKGSEYMYPNGLGKKLEKSAERVYSNKYKHFDTMVFRAARTYKAG